MNKDAQALWDLLLEIGRRRSLRDPLLALVEGLELTPPQLHAISWLGVEGSLPISVLAQRIGCSGPSATGLVDRLEKLGYVVRQPSPDDRRVVLVALTPAGESLAGECIAVVRRRLDDLMTALKPASRRALIRLIREIEAAMKSLLVEQEENE